MEGGRAARDLLAGRELRESTKSFLSLKATVLRNHSFPSPIHRAVSAHYGFCLQHPAAWTC